MRRSLCLAWLLAGLLAAGPGLALPPLQLYVELTPPGGVLRPEPGVYGGPVVISRPITIEGGGQVTVDGEGAGTVLHVKADGVVIRGLHLTGSGTSHDQVDGGILLEANDALIEDNRIDDVLFGIHLRKAEGNSVRRNRIRSRPGEPSLRGEGIRLWNSHDNLIEENDIDQARDMVVTNSSDNRILRNRISHSRMAMELIFSPGTEVRDNHISYTGTGIMAIYSEGLRLEGNRIQHLRDIAGAAFALKDSPGALLKDNQVINCAFGLTANAPVQPENIIYLHDNLFAYNDVALYFYGEKGGHVIRNNRFEHNLVDVRVSAPTTALANDWQGNHWDAYQGMDMDGDGIGDVPHELYLYADRIWMDRPTTQFFRGSPALEVIDFMERLAPFSDPWLILRDPTPRMR